MSTPKKVIVIFGIMLIAVAGPAIGEKRGMKIIRNEAISAGAAEYRLVDPQTGETELVWIGKEGVGSE